MQQLAKFWLIHWHVVWCGPSVVAELRFLWYHCQPYWLLSVAVKSQTSFKWQSTGWVTLLVNRERSFAQTVTSAASHQFQETFEDPLIPWFFETFSSNIILGQPSAVTVFNLWHDKSVIFNNFLSTAGSPLSSLYGDPRQTSFLFQHLSVITQQYNCVLIMDSFFSTDENLDL